MWPVCHQHVNSVARHFPGQDCYFVLHSYLPNKVAHTNCNLPGQHCLAVLWYPNKAHFQVVFRVRAQLITFHAPHYTILRPAYKTGGHHPSWGH
jgi:hypothetical protein